MASRQTTDRFQSAIIVFFPPTELHTSSKRASILISTAPIVTTPPPLNVSRVCRFRWRKPVFGNHLETDYCHPDVQFSYRHPAKSKPDKEN